MKKIIALLIAISILFIAEINSAVYFPQEIKVLEENGYYLQVVPYTADVTVSFLAEKSAEDAVDMYSLTPVDSLGKSEEFYFIYITKIQFGNKLKVLLAIELVAAMAVVFIFFKLIKDQLKKIKE